MVPISWDYRFYAAPAKANVQGIRPTFRMLGEGCVSGILVAPHNTPSQNDACANLAVRMIRVSPLTFNNESRLYRLWHVNFQFLGQPEQEVW